MVYRVEIKWKVNRNLALTKSSTFCVRHNGAKVMKCFVSSHSWVLFYK